MNPTLKNYLTIMGRAMIVLIFLMSAVGNKIPNYGSVVQYMAGEGVPAPSILLAGAIVFLIAGSVSILIGFRARTGAILLFVFLVMATYFFHDFWTFDDPGDRQQQTIQFMKNLSMMGTMLFIMANGSGPMSLDGQNPSHEKAPSSVE